MNYSDKLKDPRWQKKRLKILERDEFTCRCCKGKTDTLNVHHIEYINNKMPFEYEDYYLVTLCDRCHGAWHIIYDNKELDFITIKQVVDLCFELEDQKIRILSNG